MNSPIIVCYMDWDHKPDYEVFETMAEAEARYEKLLAAPTIYSVSICRVVKSTDYDPS